MGEYRTDNPPCIAVVQKWRESFHGISEDETEYVKFLSTKYLMCWDTHYYDSDSSDVEYDDYDTVDQIDSALDFVGSRDIHTSFIESSWETRFPCIIRKTYYYRQRRFGIRNYGIEKLQKKWRDYYNKKLAFAKNIKNLQYRQLYGKYPKIN